MFSKVKLEQTDEKERRAHGTTFQTTRNSSFVSLPRDPSWEANAVIEMRYNLGKTLGEQTLCLEMTEMYVSLKIGHTLKKSTDQP